MIHMAKESNAALACLGNCNYNMTKQLAKNLQLLWNIDGYIADAKRDGHKECVKVWETIKADEQRHARMLRESIRGLARKGKFK